MNFENKEIELFIEINDGLIDRICEVGLLHYPNEFGGILIGQYSEDNLSVSISETILPSTYQSSPASFDRGTEGLMEKLLVLFNGEPSRIYVGEWHTHPNATPFPSRTDVLALQQIVASESVNINNPVMLIVGLTQTKVELGFYVYLNKKIHKYEMV